MKKSLNIRPDTGVYGTYKRISYQPWTALAEFVDNSTQSYYDNKAKLFATKYYKGLVIEIEYKEDKNNGDYIRITDNAYGMDYSDFQRALILDRPPKNTNGRNEFGMGLKAAACWFGNQWTVESTSLGSQYKYTAEIDVDSLIKYRNETIEVEEEIVQSKEHYTIITIKKLNKKVKGKRIEKKIKELLSSTYRVDLRTGEITIYYNGEELSFREVVAYIDKENREWKKEVKFAVPFLEHELEVKGFIGIRIPGSPSDAGFTLIRRGRVIVGGPERNYRPYELFGAANSFPYQRLYGELNMDNWPVTQAKDDFDWSNEDLEATFIERLKSVSDEYKQKSSEIRIRESAKSEDIVSDLKENFIATKAITDVDIKVVEIDSITDNEPEIEEEEFENEFHIIESEGGTDGVLLIDNRPIEICFKHNGNQYVFHVRLNGDDHKSKWMNIRPLAKSETAYVIDINSTHVFWRPFINKKDFLSIMIKFSVALALAEIESYSITEEGKIDPPDIRIAMNKILEELIDNE